MTIYMKIFVSMCMCVPFIYKPHFTPQPAGSGNAPSTAPRLLAPPALALFELTDAWVNGQQEKRMVKSQPPN